MRWVALGFVVSLFVACGGSSSNSMSLELREYSFSGVPSSLQAGTTRIDVSNEGKQFHVVNLARLDRGRTIDDLKRALAASSAETPTWLHDEGGVDVLGPGRSTTLTTALAPGRYAVICFLPAPDGQPHFSKGMLSRVFDVTGNSGDDLPDADATVTAGAKGFDVPSLKAGDRTLELRNRDGVDHEFFFIHVPEGKTVADVQKLFAAADATLKPPYPVDFLGGAIKVGAGRSATLHVDLPAGKAVVVDTDHADTGYLQPFEVS